MALYLNKHMGNHSHYCHVSKVSVNILYGVYTAAHVNTEI
jgi:hypothetical protein